MVAIGDIALYDAVNRSIDRTIDAIGYSVFQSALDKFVLDQGRANRECGSDNPIPSERTCYWGDSGCNYDF